MSEISQDLDNLYTQYRREVDTSRRRVDNFIQKIKKPKIDQQKARVDNIRHQIIELIRNQPGKHPLERISVVVGMSREPGFDFGFNETLGKDSFEIDYWQDNRWGILVQGHNNSYFPEIEILSRGDDRGLTLLHLPEGFRIPVGPLRFKSESTPMGTEESNEAKNKALRLAEKVGIKVSRDMQDVIDMLPEGRKYTDRYFYWQPALPEKPASIAVDFDKLNPLYMGLSLDGAPVFSDTLVVK